MIEELGENEREAIGILRKMLKRVQSFPDDMLLSYAWVNVDTATLQIESAICPRFRGINTKVNT